MHFSRKTYFFAQFFVIVIEDINTYLDVYVIYGSYTGIAIMR